MECVACTACIDACDEIMDNVGSPRGLIRYASESEIAVGARARRLQAKSIAYGAIVAVLIAGFSVAVAMREPLDVKFIRAIESPYTVHTLQDGAKQVSNHYRVKLKNQSFDTYEVSLALGERAAADGVEIVAPTYPLTMEGGAAVENHVFFKFPARLTHGTGDYFATLQLRGTSERGTETMTDRVVLVGPFSTKE
jgi:polyferredoxin